MNSPQGSTRARTIRSSLFTPRGKRAAAVEEQRERVVVSRARRGIIHPTKVAALRQEQGPTLTTYSGRRRARSIRVRGGEEVRAAGPSSRARFLAHFFSASFRRFFFLFSSARLLPAVSLPSRLSSSACRSA